MTGYWIRFSAALFFLLCTFGTAYAENSSCETCHTGISPEQVKDFNRGVMSEFLDCSDCHGSLHKDETDVSKVLLPTIETFQGCHEEQAEQYLSGKHALGLLALEAMPYTHMQPAAFVEGQKGCGGCHPLGLKDQEARKSENRKYYPL